MVRRFFLTASLILCLAGCHKSAQQESLIVISSAGAFTVSDVRFHSPAIGGLLLYRIVLPTPSGTAERLPVLYLLHGANSNPAEIMDRSDVAKLAVAEHLAVVMPNGEFSYYTNAKHKRNAQWESAITTDLLQDVSSRFPVLNGREYTGIAGISMGAYGAAKLSLKHPDVYGFAGVMSGALDITRRPASLPRWGQTWRIWTIFGLQKSSRQDEDVFHLLAISKNLERTTWFVSCGKNDPLREIAERFTTQIQHHGANLHLVVTEGGHDWQSWNLALPTLFKVAGNSLR